MHPTKLADDRTKEVVAERKFRFPTPQTFAVDACASGRHVLQLATGQGAVTAQLKRKLCHVTAIDQAAKQSRQRSTSSTIAPPLPDNVRWFDEILVMDLVEQLGDAETFLSDLRRKMARRGAEVIITVGNVGCRLSRIMRVISPFNLRRVAIPAIASRRRFTLQSLCALLEKTGYEMVEVRGIPAPFPVTMGNTRWSRALVRLNEFLLRISNELFAHQICVRARPSLGNVHRLPEQMSSGRTVMRRPILSRVA